MVVRLFFFTAEDDCMASYEIASVKHVPLSHEMTGFWCSTYERMMNVWAILCSVYISPHDAGGDMDRTEISVATNLYVL